MRENEKNDEKYAEMFKELGGLECLAWDPWIGSRRFGRQHAAVKRMLNQKCLRNCNV